MHTAQNNTVVLLGLQVPENELDSTDENGSDSVCTEATMR